MSTQITLGLHTHATSKEPLEAGTRSQRLKAATQDAHSALDQRIMAAQPFANRENYARFLRMQYCFHRDIEALYSGPLLTSVILDLRDRNRMQAVAADLRDLHMSVPPAEPKHVLPADIELPVGLGWLYVAEGSKLGAAILFKLAAELGLDELFGARHLAGHPDGRARHWREFIAALDTFSLSAAEEQEVIASARTAFDRVRAYADREFAAGSR